MIVLIHVSSALISIIFATAALFRPSRAKLYASYGFTATMLISGSYLVVITHAGLVSACTSGLLYLGVVLTETAIARKRLAAQTSQI